MGLSNWTQMLSAKSFTLVLQCCTSMGKDKLVLEFAARLRTILLTSDEYLPNSCLLTY